MGRCEFMYSWESPWLPQLDSTENIVPPMISWAVNTIAIVMRGNREFLVGVITRGENKLFRGVGFSSG